MREGDGIAVRSPFRSTSRAGSTEKNRKAIKQANLLCIGPQSKTSEGRPCKQRFRFFLLLAITQRVFPSPSWIAHVISDFNDLFASPAPGIGD
jgi:hypothetical protein